MRLPSGVVRKEKICPSDAPMTGWLYSRCRGLWRNQTMLKRFTHQPARLTMSPSWHGESHPVHPENWHYVVILTWLDKSLPGSWVRVMFIVYLFKIPIGESDRNILPGLLTAYMTYVMSADDNIITSFFIILRHVLQGNGTRSNDFLISFRRHT